MPIVAVTGGTGTLGSAIVGRFCDSGWVVRWGDSNTDVRNPNTVYRWFKDMGHIDAVVTSAGVSCVKPSLELTGAEWKHVIGVNLTGTFYAVKEAIRAGATRIVTIGSIHGCTPTSYPERVAYTASKAGVMGLTQALAVEFAPKGIAINCVAPGHLPTLMDGTGAGADLLNAARKRTPIGQLTTPEEVADTVYWLIDSAPLTLTGQIITVDGGFTLNTFPL